MVTGFAVHVSFVRFDAKFGITRFYRTKQTLTMQLQFDQQTTYVNCVCVCVCAHVHMHMRMHSLFGRLCGRSVSCMCPAVFHH